MDDASGEQNFVEVIAVVVGDGEEVEFVALPIVGDLQGLWVMRVVSSRAHWSFTLHVDESSMMFGLSRLM